MTEEAPPPPAPPPYGAPLAAPAFGVPPGPAPKTATTSLVLGIASILCLGLLAGIPAMVLGRSASKEIDASHGVLGGRGIATAGLVTGLIGTLLSLLLIVLVVGLIGIGNVIQGELQGELQQRCGEFSASDESC